MSKSKEKIRCSWCVGKPLYEQYHDEEWGVPVYDDRKQFEFLVLESAQAGLSWWTILQRRENYRKAFANFDYKKVARFDAAKVEELMQDAGIIRNRAKIEATIVNARQLMAIQKEFGSFSNYIWSFVGGQPKINQCKTLKEVVATSPESDALAKDMKKRGFKFLGSTTLYAHMQATGLVNDHVQDCHRYKACNK
ncbi:MAG TPA: DNA-3-methyladenine glycosylase I [Chitinophagales bacterium]|jgi:DNA-3-methyladenine glycosylase I|nr:DNA-3-methyladenine glycosylase I [Chitinophagales bacterium]HPA35417.1 DNA-3-methyladenine glycosylase I [Chitinophagales bacterium]HPW86247.1 DNA-3-methyladenine glycosylase I [Chitinophagales bacterium]HQD11661.1 DNA-3-methyladenine glycosylase I [Chitinophagales bacterium]HQO31475.1 DNA-3-methyladenine glycosylase I [Chitinophagales bacterium]